MIQTIEFKEVMSCPFCEQDIEVIILAKIKYQYGDANVIDLKIYFDDTEMNRYVDKFYLEYLEYRATEIFLDMLNSYDKSQDKYFNYI